MTSKLLAEVYRRHHIPLPPITLQGLLQLGPPRPPPSTVLEIQCDRSEHQKWREKNASSILKSARLLHRDIPIRLARRIVDFENLPPQLLAMPSIDKLRQNMLQSFEKMIQSKEIQTLEDETRFIEMHEGIRRDHRTVHSDLATAVQVLDETPEGLSQILDNFYDSRIGIRTLLDQHLASGNPTAGHRGIVADTCCPLDIAKNLVSKIAPIWRSQLASLSTNKSGEFNQRLVLPAFHFHGSKDATYRYIPQHIEIVLSEVIKNAVTNSLHALMERTSDDFNPPSVHVHVADGPNAISIRVSDSGGGMTREEARALFHYHRPKQAFQQGKLMESPKLKLKYDPVAADLEHRASGLAFFESFGLRVASRYASYFGGEVTLMPMEGSGVDAYIYLNCLKET